MNTERLGEMVRAALEKAASELDTVDDVDVEVTAAQCGFSHSRIHEPVSQSNGSYTT